MKNPRTVGPWRVIGERVAYENPWIRVTHHDVITPSGTDGVYGKVHYKNWAMGIIPVDEQGYTYLVGQHRFALDQYSWEIPEGGGPFDLDPRDSAARELEEETGLRAARWRELIRADLSNSVSDERAIAFLAWELTSGHTRPDPTEELRVRRLPLTETFRLVAAGEIRDALSVMSLQAVQIMQMREQLPCPCA